QPIRGIGGEVPLDQVIVDGRAGFAVSAASASGDAAGPAIGRTDPPCGASAHRLAVLPGLVGQVAIAELWVLPVGIEQRVSAVGLIEFSRGDRVLEPPVIRLASEIKYPPAPPRRGYRQQQARSRAGTTFSRQVRLRQVSGSAAQDLVLLLQQPNAAFGLAQLLGLRGGRARLDPGLDV